LEDDSEDDLEDDSENKIKDNFYFKYKLIKKIYKKIALFLHPDKNKNYKSNKCFVSSVSAYERKDLIKLIYILKQNNLDIKLNDDDIKILNLEKEYLENKFINIQKINI
jgi:hypothetical protein